MIKLNHITINVTNMQDSISFYSTFLNLSQNTTVDMGDSQIVYFSLPGAMQLELIDTFQENDCATTSQTARGKYRHLAFEVDHLDDWYRKCLLLQIPVIMPPTILKPLQCIAMLIHDPNGVEIEFTEPLPQ